jgi:hypothetical protein
MMNTPDQIHDGKASANEVAAKSWRGERKRSFEEFRAIIPVLESYRNELRQSLQADISTTSKVLLSKWRSDLSEDELQLRDAHQYLLASPAAELSRSIDCRWMMLTRSAYPR